MKKAVITGERRAEIREVPTPSAYENWALVKVHAVPMCTEYKSFLKGWRCDFLGHEAAGEVVDPGTSRRVKAGDRVVVMPQYPCGKCELCVSGDYIHCQYTTSTKEYAKQDEGGATYAQYLLKPDWLLPAIPDGVSYEHASLACCALGPSFGALEAIGVGAFDTLLITGLGPVGIGAVVNARYRGARVITVDSLPYRARLALKLGAERVIDPSDPGAIEQIRACGEISCALDCSGVPAAHRMCIEAVKRKGQVAFVGECGEDTVIHVSDDLIRKGICVRGSWHYNLSLFGKIMQVIQNAPDIDSIISHRLPMSEIQKAFEISASPDHAKIILDPWH